MSRPPDRLTPHDERMEELAAGYALDSLDLPERQELLEHLESCERCRALVAEYRAVALALPLSVSEMDASPDLKARIFRTINGESGSSAPPSAPPGAPPPPMRLDGRGRGRFSLWGLAAAAMLLVSLGLGYWNTRLQQELRQVQQSAEIERQLVAALTAGAQRHGLSATAEAPQAHGAVVPDPVTGQAFLLVGSLPNLPGDRAYQAWVVGADGPVDAGVLPAGAGGSHITRLNRAPRPGEVVALTVEPAGGVSAPTGQIVLAGTI